MSEIYGKASPKLYQGLPLDIKVKYIGRGGELPQGSEDFSKLWTDSTFTEK